MLAIRSSNAEMQIDRDQSATVDLSILGEGALAWLVQGSAVDFVLLEEELMVCSSSVLQDGKQASRRRLLTRRPQLAIRFC